MAESASAVMVKFPNKPGVFPVDYFEARIKDGAQKCSVLVSTASRECSITGLSAGTLYTILALSFGEDLESVPVKIPIYTWPQGNRV